MNKFYIDTGVGNRLGKPYKYGNYFTWLELYNNKISQRINLAKDRKVLGA